MTNHNTNFNLVEGREGCTNVIIFTIQNGMEASKQEHEQ